MHRGDERLNWANVSRAQKQKLVPLLCNFFFHGCKHRPNVATFSCQKRLVFRLGAAQVATRGKVRASEWRWVAFNPKHNAKGC